MVGHADGFDARLGVCRYSSLIPGPWHLPASRFTCECIGEHGAGTRPDPERLFDELNVELRRMGVRGDVFIVRGAAMAVAYEARPATLAVVAIWHSSAQAATGAAPSAARNADLELGL